MLFNRQNTLPSGFLHNPTFGVISQQKDFLANPKLQVAETIFWNF